jgi:phosphatidylserine/phosphatidylglycerophosphate/cardiolipin synthase-like enzyme
MNRAVRQRASLLLLALALLLPLVARAQETPAAVTEGVSAHFFGSLTSGAVAAPGPADTLFAALAGAATSTIDVALYDFNRAPVRDALLAAKARGVTVRVVGDDEVAAKPVDGAFYGALQAAGISVVTDAPRNSLQHNKFAVFDGRTVWTGSTNVSDNGFTRNGENTLVLTDTQVAQIYTTEFAEMAGGAFSNAKTNNTAHEADVAGARVEVAFSPTDGVEERIIAALASAEHSIQVAMFVLTNDRIGAELIAARARGVAVEVLLDQVQAGSTFGLRDALCAADVTVRVENWTGLLHNKYAVVDAGTASDPLVITGSTNWTASAVGENDENVVIVHSAEVAVAYAADVARLKAPIAEGAFVCNAEVGNAATPQTYLPLVAGLMTGEPPPRPPPSSREVQILAVVYDPPGDDLAGEYVLLRNSGRRAEELAGWTLRDEAGATYTFPALTLVPGAELRVWVKAGQDTGSDLFWGRGQPVWNNSGDTATLRDETGAQRAVYQYIG